MTHLKGFTFMTTLVLVFEKIKSEDKTKYGTFLFKLKSINNYQWKWHCQCISKYNTLVGSSYIKLPKELDHPRIAWIIFKILMRMNALNGVWSST